jgi:DNA-formamidopyrimidine glycosylase
MKLRRVIPIPEGPELAYSRDRIRSLIEGKSLIDLSVGISGRYVKHLPRGLTNFIEEKREKGPPRVDQVATHGKFMWWRFRFPSESRDWYMHCTYGMSGGWYTSPSKHTSFVVEYSGSGVPITRDAQKIFFNDPRHFGTVKFVDDPKEHEKKLKTLGPCILGPRLDAVLFAENVLSKPERTIAEALMDQSVVSGCGNYIKAEVLYRAGVSPWRNVADIGPEEYLLLRDSMWDVAGESYTTQGATISTYRTPDGDKGTTQFNFRVYSKKTCPKGHNIVREETPEGRTSHWCPSCQK